MRRINNIIINITKEQHTKNCTPKRFIQYVYIVLTKHMSKTDPHCCTSFVVTLLFIRKYVYKK